jgi:hypothetical protein
MFHFLCMILSGCSIFTLNSIILICLALSFCLIERLTRRGSIILVIEYMHTFDLMTLKQEASHIADLSLSAIKH